MKQCNIKTDIEKYDNAHSKSLNVKQCGMLFIVRYFL